MSERLSEKGKQLFDDFESAAMGWGWTQDQGYGSRVDRSEEGFKEAKEDLLKYIESLENQHFWEL